MTYKIISTNGNQTEISVDIDGVEYTSLVICNEGELDSAVAEFIDSIKNPRTFKQVEAVDTNALIQELNAKVTALEEQVINLGVK